MSSETFKHMQAFCLCLLTLVATVDVKFILFPLNVFKPHILSVNNSLKIVTKCLFGPFYIRVHQCVLCGDLLVLSYLFHQVHFKSNLIQ